MHRRYPALPPARDPFQRHQDHGTLVRRLIHVLPMQTCCHSRSISLQEA
ncbi:hypothetical protein ID866_12758 [Astraeus odoratus]|nr:hypothetical protein ID866_12758 [Astraeus odoratus]